MESDEETATAIVVSLLALLKEMRKREKDPSG